MLNHAHRAFFLFSWFLMSCLSAQAQLRREPPQRPPAYDSLGVFRAALERAAEAGVAVPMLLEPSSKAGCSAADAAAQPCPMRILFHGFVGQWRTGLGAISSEGISDVTDLALPTINTEISHDGEFVAYDTCNISDHAIYVVSLETSAQRKVISIGASRVCPDVRWSRDDRMLSYPSPANDGLNVVSVDGSNHVRLPTTGYVDWHSWSPSGEEIVYANGGGGGRSLKIINLQGNIRELTRLGDIQEVTRSGEPKDCETWAPDWSPDGARISFTACARLYTISPQRTDLQKLAFPSYSPRWSVDGQWIFFLSNSDVMRVKRDGQFLSKVARLPPPYSGSSPFSLGMAR